MRWPWQSEKRDGGGYTDAIIAALEASASASVADVGASAAVEAASGALSRAFAIADVKGPEWIKSTITPFWLSQVGRSLIREGASLSVISMSGTGTVELIPASYWNFETDTGSGESEESWKARAAYAP